MNSPLGLGDLCVDHSAGGRVVQAPRVVKDASVDSLLDYDH